MSGRQSPVRAEDRRREIGNRRQRLVRRLAMRGVAGIGNQHDIDRAVAFLLRDLDLPHGAVLIRRTLHDRNRDADVGKVLGNIPIAEFRIEPGVVPAIEGVVGILVPARQFLFQVRGLIGRLNFGNGSYRDILDDEMRGDQRDALDAVILASPCIDRRDRGAVGMSELQASTKPNGIEQFRQHV